MKNGEIEMPELDEIGPWTQVKHDIVKKYATEYSRILSRQPGLHHVYIDAFSGAGITRLKGSQKCVPGSPQNALEAIPKF